MDETSWAGSALPVASACGTSTGRITGTGASTIIDGTRGRVGNFSGDACVEFGERRGTAVAHYVRPGSGFEGRPALLIIRTGKMAHPRCGKQVANGGIAYQLIKSRRALTIRFSAKSRLYPPFAKKRLE